MSERPREEHLAWCKQRALEYLDEGNVTDAIASMLSDLMQHPECTLHPAIKMLGLMHARDGSVEETRRWIEGFR